MAIWEKLRQLQKGIPAFAAACAILAMTDCVAKSEAPPVKESTEAATGILTGKLTDTHSLPLAEASVIVRNLSTGSTARGVTGKNGGYRFTNLSPGEYRLEADVPQLGKGAVEGILISTGHATRVQAALVMELPPIPVGDASGLDPVEPAVTTQLSGEELLSIPVSSRDWQAFAAITPAANPATTAHGGQIGDSSSVNRDDEPPGQTLSLEGFGASASATGGTASIDGFPSTPAFESIGGHESRGGPSLGESAVLSFQARTGNAPAESLQSSPGSINLTTNRGRNGLHGQAFYLNRQSLWGAQNPYTQWIKEAAPADGTDTAQFTAEPYTPANGRQSFGIGAGSQLGKKTVDNKFFWFAALDGMLRDDPALATVRHQDNFFARPTNDELTVLAARLDLPGPAVLENAVSAYSSGLEGLAGLLGPVPRNATQLQGFARLDWQPGERHHLSLEGNAASFDSPAGALGLSSETYGSHSFGNSHANDASGMVRLNSFLTANLLNSAGLEYRRHLESDRPQAPSAFEAPLVANPWGQLPEIIADSSYGFVLGKPSRLGGGKNPDESGIFAQDTLNWVRGPHMLKFGGSLHHISDSVDTLLNQTGTYSYADVLNLISDQQSFLKYGYNGIQNPEGGQHNCDATGRISAQSNGTLSGLGYLPCYAWYSQRIGPADWSLSTNDIAAFATEQWRLAHNLILSAGIRVEAQQLPPSIASVANPELPQTEKLPATTLDWAPRIGLAWSPWRGTNYGTVFRLGAGLYYGRVNNSAILAALTQTGSPSSDLNFFFRPTDTGAPPFPYVFPNDPATVVTPGAVFFAPHFRPQEIDQAIAGIEQSLPGHWSISISGMASLGRRLPVSIDTNLVEDAKQTVTYTVVDPLHQGPIKTPQITVPFYTQRTNADYQQLATIESRANSTYEAGLIKLTRSGGHGLSLHAHYLYAHAADWNPNEGGNVATDDVLDPSNLRLEYGTSNLDIRHSGGTTILYQTPWKLHNWAGALANGWGIATVGQFRSGLPFTMRTGGYIPGYYSTKTLLVEGVGSGINGSGGDNRLYSIGRNTYRYPATWTADARLAKRFNFAGDRQLELLAESFNLFNHQNVTLIETTGYTIERGGTTGGFPTLNFLTGLTKAGLPSTIPEFGQPLDVNATNFFRQREIQLGLRTRF